MGSLAASGVAVVGDGGVLIGQHHLHFVQGLIDVLLLEHNLFLLLLEFSLRIQGA